MNLHFKQIISERIIHKLGGKTFPEYAEAEHGRLIAEGKRTNLLSVCAQLTEREHSLSRRVEVQNREIANLTQLSAGNARTRDRAVELIVQSGALVGMDRNVAAAAGIPEADWDAANAPDPTDPAFDVHEPGVDGRDIYEDDPRTEYEEAGGHGACFGDGSCGLASCGDNAAEWERREQEVDAKYRALGIEL